MQPKGKQPIKPPTGQTPAARKETKEDRIKKMIQQDPEKAAELLRQLFLNGK